MLYMDGKAQYTIQKGMGNMGELFTVEYAKRSRPLSMKTDHFHSDYEIFSWCRAAWSTLLTVDSTC